MSDEPAVSDDQRDDVPDVSAAYHLWDDLFDAGVRLALSAPDDSPEELARARARFVRGWSRALAERDAMWERIVRAMKKRAHGGE